MGDAHVTVFKLRLFNYRVLGAYTVNYSTGILLKYSLLTSDQPSNLC